MDARRGLATLAVGLVLAVGLILWRTASSGGVETPQDAIAIAGERSDGVAGGELEPVLASSGLSGGSRADALDPGSEGGIAGRLVDLESGAGLAGFDARLWGDGHWIASVETDERGWFHLPAPPAPRGSVAVWPLRGWTVTETAQVVEAREDGRYAELAFHARASKFAKFR